MKKTILIILAIILFVILIGLPIFYFATPIGVAIRNNWFYTVQKVDDTTNYQTIKKVEDTCRAMISSYTSDKLIYEQYCNSDSEEKQSWAEKAKMRANKTATIYNNYILENSFVWSDNVPANIYEKLEYLEDNNDD